LQNKRDMYYSKIEKARRILGLGKKATLGEIKKAYRDLVKKNHPDRHSEEDKAIYDRKIARINQAYEELMAYVAQFEISFEKDIVEQYDPEKPIRRFKGDWLGQ